MVDFRVTAVAQDQPLLAIKKANALRNLVNGSFIAKRLGRELGNCRLLVARKKLPRGYVQLCKGFQTALWKRLDIPLNSDFSATIIPPPLRQANLPDLIANELPGEPGGVVKDHLRNTVNLKCPLLHRRILGRASQS